MHFWKQGSLLPWIHFNPGRNKTHKKQVKAIQQAKVPNDVKTIRSFVSLCNFFLMHIKEFAIIAAPYKLTWKDSGYKGGPLPAPAMDAFINLHKQLVSEPVMAFPRTDQQYALRTDTAIGTADTPGGFLPKWTTMENSMPFHLPPDN